jgi:hypothetical protein
MNTLKYAGLRLREAENAVDADSLNAALPGKLRSKAFRARIERSYSNKSSIVPFLASVNIDLKRHRPIGLLGLFNKWLELGNKNWLNPMDKENGLGVLEEILFKFHGNTQVLTPFIEVLIKVTQNGISPVHLLNMLSCRAGASTYRIKQCFM